MSFIRTALHGFVLTVANLIGIIVGFVAAANSTSDNRVTLQLVVAILYSILLFLAWSLSLRNLPSRFSRGASLQGPREHVAAYASSLIWNPILFIPLHYFTQGYLTSAGNIAALLFFRKRPGEYLVDIGRSRGSLEQGVMRPWLGGPRASWPASVRRPG